MFCDYAFKESETVKCMQIMDLNRRLAPTLAAPSLAQAPMQKPFTSSCIDDPIIIANMRGVASAISASQYKNAYADTTSTADGAHELKNYRLQTLPFWGGVKSVWDVFVLLRDVILGMIIVYLLTSATAMKSAHENFSWAFESGVEASPAFLTNTGSIAAASLFGAVYFGGSFFI